MSSRSRGDCCVSTTDGGDGNDVVLTDQGGTVTDFDFGDAPDPYPTRSEDNGAVHAATGLTLGATRDGEPNGTPSAGADSDGADEDGVTFGTIQVGGLDQVLTVNVQGAAGKLDAWIDFDGDGNWGGPGEQIFSARDVAVGDTHLT